MSTQNTPGNTHNILKNLSALSDKIGPEKVSELLLTLSQEGDYAAAASMIKQITASYFSISVEEIVSGSSHHHSQIRSLCFHILHKTIGIPVRQVGALFQLRESATHRQIKAMQDVIDRPHIDKNLNEAYSVINSRFAKLKQIRKENLAQGPAIKKPDMDDLYDGIRKTIKDELKKLGLTTKDLAKLTDIPKTNLYEFLSGERGIKTSDLIIIQQYLNLPTIV